LAPKIFKVDCRIDWKREAENIHNFIRGLSPYPAAWTELTNGQQRIALKIFRSSFERKHHNDLPGKIYTDSKNYFRIAVPDGFVSVESLQQAGKKRMEIVEFLRGFQNPENYTLVV
jgi:methionyl-tRNA formyltransferase